jgi:hypothetical protein
MQGLSSMDLKTISMTDEYAAQYFHKNGYLWARLEIMKEQETWGKLRDQRIEKELREKIIKEIDEARKPYLELAKDKKSEDYLYYNGFCNAMNFAKVIVRNPDNE